MEANIAYACEAFEAVLTQVDAPFRELDWAEDRGHVWVQSHPELGFAYNMDQWQRAHQALLTERDEAAR